MPPHCASRLLLAGLLVASAILAPASPLPSWPAVSRNPEVEIEYAGCKVVLLGGPHPVCIRSGEPDELPLTLWTAAPVDIRADGRPVASSGLEVDGGWRHRPAFPPRTRQLALYRQGRPIWVLRLASELPAGMDDAGADLSDRARGERDPAAAIALALEAARLRRASGFLRQEIQDATFAVHQLLQLRRFADARAVLDGLRLPSGAPAEAVFLVRYYRGLLADKIGDVRSANPELRQAERSARRVGLDRLRLFAGEVLALELQSLGRSAEAAARFAELARDRSALAPCQQAELLNNQAWSQILAREGGQEPPDPAPLLDEAEAIVVQQKGCPTVSRFNLELNLALSRLQAGRAPEAAATLRDAAASAADATPDERLWQRVLEARIALTEGHPQTALEIYRRLGALAEASFSPDGRWQAAFGQGMALEALGRRNEALAALAEAERQLDVQTRLIPLTEGRRDFVVRHARATRETLALLAAAGRRDEALAAARRSRSRVLRQLAKADLLAHLPPARRQRWERALADYQAERAALESEMAGDWRLADDELRARQTARAARAERLRTALDQAFAALADPAVDRAATLAPAEPGELLLAYHRLPEPGRWLALASLNDQVAAQPFTWRHGLAEREMSARLLAPFAGQIERAQRIRVLPDEELWAVDFHTLPFAGRPLFLARPVVYGLDLPARPPRATARRALVVSDPTGELPQARLEAEEARQALAAAGWSVTFLAGVEADAARLSGALAGASLLHYAGHGRYLGRGGWESTLPLAGDTRLTLSDLLALPEVPAEVVLSACEAGHPGDGDGDGLNLAQAFLLAGAGTVVAATGEVDDRTARLLFADLYREWPAAPDLAVAFQRAASARFAADPAGGWRRFRLLVP